MTSETKAPTVSICMPVYNGENFVADAIASILAQTFRDFELIVTDNASTDRTEAIIRDFARRDRRVRYIRNPTNFGAAENYNLGYRLSRGRYVKWAAHDDLLSEDFLERTVSILERDPKVSIAFGRVQFIDEAGRPRASKRRTMPEILEDGTVARFRRAIREVNDCYPIFGLYRRDQLARSSLHRKSYYGSDRALLAEMLIFGKLKIDEEAVFCNRVHGGQSTALRTPEEQAVWQDTSAGKLASLWRFQLLAHLFEIAGKHGDMARSSDLRAEVLKFALQPRELRQLARQSLRLLLPDPISSRLRSLIWGARA
jgi:hypothetical protein